MLDFRKIERHPLKGSGAGDAVGREVGASVGLQDVEGVVGAVGVVMEKDQVLDVGGDGEF